MGFGNKKDFGRRRGFSKGFRSLVDSLLAITKAYIERVTTDGGSVVNDGKNNDFYVYTTDNNLYNDLFFAHLHKYSGYIKDGSERIQKIYDLSSNEIDLTQNTGNQQPLFVANSGIEIVGERGLQSGNLPLDQDGNIEGLNPNGSIQIKLLDLQDSGGNQNFVQFRDSSGDFNKGLYTINAVRQSSTHFILRIIHNSGEGNVDIDSVNSFEFGNDYEFSFVGNNGQLELYVNGQQEDLTGSQIWLSEVVFANSARITLNNNDPITNNALQVSAGVVFVNNTTTNAQRSVMFNLME